MKSQVTLEYDDEEDTRIHTMLMSVQHKENYNEEEFKKYIKEEIMNKIAKEHNLNTDFRVLINPTGKFVIGGPEGDAGLTGRKIIVDTYGGYSRHGGGCFSGKDPSKVDRSAAYMLRHIAKNLVANNYCKKCEIQVSYAIGMKEPLSIYINTFGTGINSEEELVKIVKEKFDLTPDGIINYLDLKRPIYSETCNGGHFGRKYIDEEEKIECTWEKLDSVDVFKKLK